MRHRDGGDTSFYVSTIRILITSHKNFGLSGVCALWVLIPCQSVDALGGTLTSHAVTHTTNDSMLLFNISKWFSLHCQIFYWFLINLFHQFCVSLIINLLPLLLYFPWFKVMESNWFDRQNWNHLYELLLDQLSLGLVSLYTHAYTSILWNHCPSHSASSILKKALPWTFIFSFWLESCQYKCLGSQIFWFGWLLHVELNS